MTEVLINVGATPERALEIADRVEKGKKVVLEINPTDNPEGASKEAENIRRRAERVAED